MKLPNGYTTESHWTWSMSDPSFHSRDTTVWAELLDDNYLIDSPKQESAASGQSRQTTTNTTGGTDAAARVNDKGRSESTDSTSSTDSTDTPSRVPSRDDAPLPSATQLVARPRVRTVRSQRQKELVDIGRNLQRIKQRQAQQLPIRTESTESIVDDDNDDLDCECTGCRGRKAMGSQPGGQRSETTILARLNAISF